MPDAAPPTPVTSAHWTANVRQQVVAQLAGGSLPAAGTEGRMFAVTDRDRYEYDTGAAIIPGEPWGSAGRVGLSVTRVANFSVPTGTGTYTPVSWDTESFDSEGVFTPHATTATTYTIPANRGGLYTITAKIDWASSPGANSVIEILVGATAWGRTVITAATQALTCGTTATLALAATNVVSIRLSQGSGGAINVTGAWQLWRISA